MSCGNELSTVIQAVRLDSSAPHLVSSKHYNMFILTDQFLSKMLVTSSRIL